MPSESRLGLSIKAAGDYTSELHDTLKTGTPAKLAGPYGEFDYHRGGRDQIWIAGGIGVTPFLSWIHALDGAFDLSVDFFHSVSHDAAALYLDEIQAVAGSIRRCAHGFIDTEHDGS